MSPLREVRSPWRSGGLLHPACRGSLRIGGTRRLGGNLWPRLRHLPNHAHGPDRALLATRTPGHADLATEIQKGEVNLRCGRTNATQPGDGGAEVEIPEAGPLGRQAEDARRDACGI